MALDFDALVLVPSVAVFGEANDAFAGDQRPQYTPAAPNSVMFRIDGVFTDGYVNQVLIDDGAPGFVTDNPTLGVRAAQFAAPPVEGDRVFIPRTGKTYLVNEPQPDGVGAILLQLNEV